MADVEINVGTDGSHIEGSNIKVNAPEVQHQQAEPRHSHPADTISKLEARVSRIEELLGGYLGIPGLTQEIILMKQDVAEIKDEIQRTYVHPAQYVMLLFSIGSLVLAVLVTALGLWR